MGKIKTFYEFINESFASISLNESFYESEEEFKNDTELQQLYSADATAEQFKRYLDKQFKCIGNCGIKLINDDDVQYVSIPVTLSGGFIYSDPDTEDGRGDKNFAINITKDLLEYTETLIRVGANHINIDDPDIQYPRIFIGKSASKLEYDVKKDDTFTSFGDTYHYLIDLLNRVPDPALEFIYKKSNENASIQSVNPSDYFGKDITFKAEDKDKNLSFDVNFSKIEFDDKYIKNISQYGAEYSSYICIMPDDSVEIIGIEKGKHFCATVVGLDGDTVRKKALHRDEWVLHTI